MAAAKYRVSKEFRALKDYQPFAEVAQTTRERIFRQLETQKLGEAKREVVYSFGAAEDYRWTRSTPAGGGVILWRSLICENCFRRGCPFRAKSIFGRVTQGGAANLSHAFSVKEFFDCLFPGVARRSVAYPGLSYVTPSA
ncbi:MAG: hypothetical protein H0U60_06770 [Blastocatellia bacterium]|nr:hypothetical protein [Blastocatellia bacterium]